MANYEYLDIDEYRDYIVGKAQTKLTYNSNITKSDSLTAILNDLFDDAYNIIVKWRKLKTDDEFLGQKWDTEITNFVVDSYRTMGDETLKGFSVNGISKDYRNTPEGRLRSSIPQIM